MKIKINNKGMNAGEIGKWLIVLVFLVIMFTLITSSTRQGKNILKDVLNGDFDGDNTQNSFGLDISDPCPCGIDNVKQTYNSINYCVAGYTEAECTNVNTLAVNMYKKDEGKNKNPVFFFMNGNKCLYSVEGCKYYIASTKE